MEGYLGTFPVPEDDARNQRTPAEWAMIYITSYGQIDGEHHKTWVLDQVARILKGTPVVVTEARWSPNEQYPDGLAETRFTTGSPSDRYLEWVEEMLGDDIDGEREYDYDEGIAP